ncbi:DVU0524 family FlgM-associated protein [Desulfoferrobacter suflitae]|uniref:DVU0524 family FlgM-associated protein n=1 Tax=Desulfoferrobacter suflitae TaxID=2865782 RepID=UPI002164570B|nr:DVU0524 family FlgM-associated protein [Desulfoferrobacter suflitae]MCK8602406.1 hypothetical protein [Desulfoferrobacter suflitae]
MVITDSRIQNVLRTYSNQLQRSKLSSKLEAGIPRLSEEKVSISEEGRRRSIMEHVAHKALEQAYPRNPEANETI